MFRSVAVAWADFWHTPLRAERLGLMRLLLGLCLLSDQLLSFLPRLADVFGPHGIAPATLHTESALDNWRWTALFFHTDDLQSIQIVFWCWVAATALFTVGLFTRLANVAVWLLTLCFFTRCRFLLNGGYDMLQVALFLLLLAPCGRALSVDAWLRRQRTGDCGPAFTPAWPVRLLQIQLVLIYCSTGLLKLKGYPALFEGTWWEGTSVHYTLNFVDRARFAYAQFPVPAWLTAGMTYFSVAWETLFPLLVLSRWTRGPTLLFGVLFHVGIFCVLEIGWFSLYALCYYAVWIPDRFWKRFDRQTSRPL